MNEPTSSHSDVPGEHSHDHQHDHSLESDESFWLRSETLVTVVAGVMFFTGILIHLLEPLDATLGTYLGYQVNRSTLLFLLTIVIGSWYTARRGVKAVVFGTMSVDFLITTALVGAIILGEFLEAGALAFLYGVAELLEDWAMITAQSSLEQLANSTPEEANVVTEAGEQSRPVQELEVGDVVVVRPGERVATDGVVVKGRSSVDESPVTGESMPVTKSVDDQVYAGSINRDGYIEFRVSRPFDQNTISNLIRMVREAEQADSPSQRFVDRFAAVYTPAVVGLALVIGLVVPLVLGGGWPSFSRWFLRAMALLVIACPCGLLISTPVTIVSGITSAARHGTLIKDGTSFEYLGQLDLVVFDKTGTLTVGEPEVSDVQSFGDRTTTELLRVAASLEHGSEHPIGRAIVNEANNRDLSLQSVEDFQALTGVGVKGLIGGTLHQVGKRSMFEEDPAVEKSERESTSGTTVVYVGTSAEPWGRITLRDEIRADAKPAVQALHERGIQVAMLTGDDQETARTVADEIGIDDVYGDLLPEDKVDTIDRLRDKHDRIAMVGDGINDAPALARADVGIAMGAAGTDTALETADVAFLGDDLSKLDYVNQLSTLGERIIQQNIYGSIVVKLILALGIIPGWVTLITAVLVGDMAVSFAITGNAYRLRWVLPGDTTGTDYE